MTTATTSPKVGMVVDMGSGQTATVSHCAGSEYVTFSDGSYMTRSEWRKFDLPIVTKGASQKSMKSPKLVAFRMSSRDDMFNEI